MKILEGDILIENLGVSPTIIGKGGCGVVYLCKNKNFVVKRIPLTTHIPWFELYIMKSSKLHHKNINKGIYKMYSDGIYIFQEKALGDIKSLSLESEEDVYSTMGEIVKGVTYLHEHGIVHGDLKPSNVLFFEGGDIRITDFGLSTSIHWMRKAKIGTQKYRAPETDHDNWGFSIDVWGLGQILKLFIDKIKTCSSELTHIKERMLEICHEKRITLQEIRDFFTPPQLQDYSPFKFPPLRDKTEEFRRVKQNLIRQGMKPINANVIAKQLIFKEESRTTARQRIEIIRSALPIIDKMDLI